MSNVDPFTDEELATLRRATTDSDPISRPVFDVDEARRLLATLDARQKIVEYGLKNGLGESFSQMVKRGGATLSHLTDLLVAAYVKECNITPSECEIVQESTGLGFKIYMRRREVAVAEQAVIEVAREVFAFGRPESHSKLGDAIEKLDQVKR